MKKVQFLHVDFAELAILKDQLMIFVKHQEGMIERSSDVSERYNRLIMHDVGTALYFSFGMKMVNNLKSHGKTQTTFSISIAEASLLQFVCSFTTPRNEMENYTMGKFARIIDEKIQSIIF